MLKNIIIIISFIIIIISYWPKSIDRPKEVKQNKIVYTFQRGMSDNVKSACKLAGDDLNEAFSKHVLITFNKEDYPFSTENAIMDIYTHLIGYGSTQTIAGNYLLQDHETKIIYDSDIIINIWFKDQLSNPVYFLNAKTICMHELIHTLIGNVHHVNNNFIMHPEYSGPKTLSEEEILWIHQRLVPIEIK